LQRAIDSSLLDCETAAISLYSTRPCPARGLRGLASSGQIIQTPNPEDLNTGKLSA